MLILYDSQIFDEQRVGGASRYWQGLVQALERVPGCEPLLAMGATANRYARNLRRAVFWGPRWLNRRLAERLLKRGNFDVFHPTYYDPYFLKYIRQKPYVVTVFDMIHERLPQYFPVEDVTRSRKALLVRRASAVVAISERTKRDVVELLGMAPEKVHVVPLATALGDVTARPIPDAPVRFLLYVGQRGKYKNFSCFVRAVAPILRSDSELNLFCAGGRPWDAGEEALFATEGIGQQVRRYDVSDEELAWLYRQALALVYPSLYEGFGLPVLEAFACGCPVAASSAGALPEVGALAAHYFNATDETDVRQTVQRLVEDRELRQRLKAAGCERVQLFSWERVARETAAVYADVA